MKRVSVIIPCYNTEKYLARCVDSVLAQTENSIEIILVDDGSTDSTCTLCDHYAMNHGNITALHISNSGPASAKNRGMEIATGEYFSFIDSDDEIAPTMYERMLELQADIICCNYRQIDEAGNRSHEKHTGQRCTFDRAEGLRRLLDKDKIYSQGWTKIFNRKMLLDNNVRFIEGLKTEEDFLFNLDAFLASERIALDDTPYYIYTHREQSLSREYHLKHATRFAQNMTMRLERTESLLRHDYPQLSTSLTMHCAAYYNLMAGRISQCEYTPYKPFISKAINYMRKHAITILMNHSRCGLSLAGALLILLLPQRYYHKYRSSCH